MINQYQRVVVLNLLAKHKRQEQMLTDKMNQLFNRFQNERVTKFHYDFHSETKGDKFEHLDDLLHVLKDSLLNTFGYWIENKIIDGFDLQKGVYRTNCLDCLDRTNVTQAKIAILILTDMLRLIFDHIKQKGTPSNPYSVNNEI